jgi:hypothetical protein
MNIGFTRLSERPTINFRSREPHTPSASCRTAMCADATGSCIWSTAPGQRGWRWCDGPTATDVSGPECRRQLDSGSTESRGRMARHREVQDREVTAGTRRTPGTGSSGAGRSDVQDRRAGGFAPSPYFLPSLARPTGTGMIRIPAPFHLPRIAGAPFRHRGVTPGHRPTQSAPKYANEPAARFVRCWDPAMPRTGCGQGPMVFD